MCIRDRTHPSRPPGGFAAGRLPAPVSAATARRWHPVATRKGAAIRPLATGANVRFSRPRDRCQDRQIDAKTAVCYKITKSQLSESSAMKRGQFMQEKILEILRHASDMKTAYQIMDDLRGAVPTIAPPTVYRALKVLIEKGDVHRLETRNAYYACRSAGDHIPIISVCDSCGTVEESIEQDVLKRISEVTQKAGFQARKHVVEVTGLCALCSDAGSAR